MSNASVPVRDLEERRSGDQSDFHPRIALVPILAIGLMVGCVGVPGPRLQSPRGEAAGAMYPRGLDPSGARSDAGGRSHDWTVRGQNSTDGGLGTLAPGPEPKPGPSPPVGVGPTSGNPTNGRDVPEVTTPAPIAGMAPAPASPPATTTWTHPARSRITPIPRLVEAEEAKPQYPNLHDDPLAGSGIPESERDPFLFPWLMNLIVEDKWDLNRDPAAARAEVRGRRARVDINDPGPDTANFPNAAYTLPKGRVYIETSPVGFYGPSTQTTPQYNWEFLLRYGLTDNLELRLFSNGLTVAGKPSNTTGFSPLAFDVKMNFWEENPKYFLPAFGLEVYIETDMGSPAFNGGTQPSVNILFDQTLPLDIQFEYNFSISGVRVVPGLSSYVFGFQWSFQRALFDEFAVFTHGFYNASSLPRLPSIGIEAMPQTPTTLVVGGGAVWSLTERLAVFGSYNAGLTRDSPTTIALFGFAVAF